MSFTLRGHYGKMKAGSKRIFTFAHLAVMSNQK
jgi:hypothetical protein